ncbi:Disease resistance protein [Melia azedarach]|uniref:Disease resistance protein n=1 Tax=Melia azedarach TaxID=155640 RepID=A0ACC1Y4Q1_MELAZ|nr:Disease resistance protein [Melia azedarach]
MGNICSIQISYDAIFSKCWDCIAGKATYLYKLEENLAKLETAMEELNELRNDVKMRVRNAEEQQLRPLDQVQGWLRRVEAMVNEVNELIADGPEEIEKLCVERCCSRNCMSSLQVREKALVEGRPSEATVGLEPMCDKLWSCLVNEETKSKAEIGEKIGFSDDRWKNKSIDQKAIDIFRVLSRKKFVLLLDDIWERIELTKLGIPHPTRENRSKVIFTTRSEEVCGRMEADKKIKVECLGWEDAWNLFRRKVGEEALNMHWEIPKLAETVAKECGGLPLALITIGRAMACKKTPQEWQHAIMVLKRTASAFSGMGEEVFPLLKFSYDNLPTEKVRACFLFCALFPEDFLIKKSDLVDYWICEEILDFDEYEGIIRASNQGFDIIGTLLYACLLEDIGDKVKMHDVIRDMALWIANDCGNAVENFLVLAGTGINKAPEVAKWRGIKKMSLMANHIEELTQKPACSNLFTLFLNDNHLHTIGNDFFHFMPALRVLDLSKNEGIIQLPTGISELVSLLYLNLSKTGIRQLPIELKNLIKLKYLNLDLTRSLSVIPRQVMSSFSMLQVLKMIGCGYSVEEASGFPGGNEDFVQELESLEHLNTLGVTIRNATSLQSLLHSHKLQSCIQALLLKNFSSSNLIQIAFLENLNRIHELRIIDCTNLEELSIDLVAETTKMLQQPWQSVHRQLLKVAGLNMACFRTKHYITQRIKLHQNGRNSQC